MTAKIETLREEVSTIESEVGDHNSPKDIVSRLSSELNSKQDELEDTISEFERRMNESQDLIENLDSKEIIFKGKQMIVSNLGMKSCKVYPME